MGPKDKKKKSREKEDPDVVLKRKFKAKCQFRALYRLVHANAYWLIEDVDHYEGVDDVQRRVQQAVRSKSKKKQLLTIKDKALLNKDANERTEAEKRYLYRIIGGLKCFKKYPNHVKRKLAAVTYFKYYSPGRTIVRQHQDAHALYFIVTGDVVVSQMIFDDLLHQFVSIEIGVLHAGDMFGEVSLLHNIPRTATCTTVGHCELLALMKEDFKNVLQASVQKQWDEVSHAMGAFTYFDSLDAVALREGCIVARMKSYERDETILGDGMGVHNFVYFVLSGRCQMIETLQMTVKTRLGIDYYTLYDPYIPKEESEQDLDAKYFQAYKNLNQSTTAALTESAAKTGSQQKDRPSEVSKTKTNSILKPDSANQLKLSTTNENPEITPDGEKRESVSSALRSDKGSVKSQVLLSPTESQTRQRMSVRLSVVPEVAAEPPPPPSNLRTYFMQVCQFGPGATFGFGENMRDRRIVTMTKVDCMLMPLVWLLQRNSANIWTRIHHYLEKKIPSKKQLFKEFVKERRWMEYRTLLVEDKVESSNTVNFTNIHDVPYSIRLEEMYDI